MTDQPSTQALTLARCPAITTRAWVGKTFRCELSVGHEGLHTNSETPMAFEWDYDDSERSDD